MNNKPTQLQVNERFSIQNNASQPAACPVILYKAEGKIRNMYIKYPTRRQGLNSEYKLFLLFCNNISESIFYSSSIKHNYNPKLR